MALLSERRFISPRDVIPGMFVQFSYKPKYDDREESEYTVLVIDPDRENEHATSPQLHGIKLNGMSDFEIILILSTLTKLRTEGVTFDLENRRVSVASLNSDDVYDAYLESNAPTERRYRTFSLDSISGGTFRQILMGAITENLTEDEIDAIMKRYEITKTLPVEVAQTIQEHTTSADEVDFSTMTPAERYRYEMDKRKNLKNNVNWKKLL